MMSSYDDEFRGAAGPSAARVGADLRAARERLGWTLPAIAGHLRIRLPFLQAIEDGKIELLPGNAYAIGFLRTYAQALGLDPDEVARRFRAEAAEVEPQDRAEFPGAGAGARHSGRRDRAGRRADRDRRLCRLVPDVGDQPPDGRDGAAGAGAAGAAGRDSRKCRRRRWRRPAKPPADAADAPPVPSINPGSAAADVAPHGYATSAVPPQPTPSPVVAPADPAPVPMPPQGPDATRIDGPRIVLRAKAEAWIQVREKGGQVLLNRVLRPGETWQVPAKPSLLLTTGNAAGTELLVDGSPTPSLGGDGAVRRDLPLDADAIKEGKLAPGGTTPTAASATAVPMPPTSAKKP